MDDNSFKRMLTQQEKKQLLLEQMKKGIETGNQDLIDRASTKMNSLPPQDALDLQQKARQINDKLKTQKGLEAYGESQAKRMAEKMPSASTLKSIEGAADVVNEPNIHLKGSAVADEIAKMQNVGKFKRIMGMLGSRAAKAIPYIGTGAGLLAAKDALAKGDKVGATLEAISAVDPTPISDIVLAGKDIYDIAKEPSQKQKPVQLVKKANIVNPSHQDDMVYSEKQKSEKEPLEEQSKKLKNMFNLITGR